MKRSKKKFSISSLLILAAAGFSVIYMTMITLLTIGKLASAKTTNPHYATQQQGTFEFITVTPKPGVSLVPQSNTQPQQTPSQNSGPINPKPLVTGGAAKPTDPFYCIDDEDPEGCDDQTAFHVPKGTGGAAGQCGTIMENAHKLVQSLPQGLKGFRDSLNPAVQTACGNSGTYSSGYISTFFVIDTFNLTGFNQLSKADASHATGNGMLTFFQTQQSGYKFIPYTPTVLQQYASGQQNLTGCVMFIRMPSGGVHVGIVNAFEVVNAQGDGVLSMLQSGAAYFIDRFPVTGWDVKNTAPLHGTNITGVEGFGCKI